jgi:hypothetical protein
VWVGPLVGWRWPRPHAVLHQASRQRDQLGRIIATLDDYAVVRELVADTIAEGVGATVSERVRETIAAVEELASHEGVMNGAIAAKLNIDKSNASRRLRTAADGGYVRNLAERGKPGRWVIGEPLPETRDLLPQPAQLAQHATGNNIVELRGCGVAPISEEENNLTAPTPQPSDGRPEPQSNGFQQPTGPGRCNECGYHVPAKGHRDGCTANTDA